jgi:hypothetical protein
VYTFGDKLDLLSVLLGDPNTTVDDMYPIDVRKKFINRGEIHFAVDSKCLRDYVAGNIASQEISLPNGWFENHVLLVDNRDVSKFEIALQEYERYLNAAENYWYQWTVTEVEKIFFLNSSGGADLTDTSKIPIEYREASVYWAAAELMKQIGKTDLSNQYLAMYASYIQSAEADAKRKYLNRPSPSVDVGEEQSGQSDVDRQGRGSSY